jgi:FKBP-type peptidyl-prolyl cis-trans isomerase
MENYLIVGIEGPAVCIGQEAKMVFALFVALSAAVRFIPVTADGKVRKHIDKTGTGGQKPTDDQRVQILYKARPRKGKHPFDQADQPFTFTVGHGVIPGWSAAVKSMTKGEKATFEIDAEYGYGERGVPPVVPPHADLTYTVTLVDIL